LESTDTFPSTHVSASKFGGRPGNVLRFGASRKHPSEASTQRRRRKNCNRHARSYSTSSCHLCRNWRWRVMFDFEARSGKPFGKHLLLGHHAVE
jgi:hypothetical protein